MKKLILFAIFAISTAPNAWAVCPTIGENKVDCTSAGYPNCCAPSLFQCASKCQYTITAGCPSNCNSLVQWKTNSTTHMESICIKNQQSKYVCLSHCEDGYYMSGTEEIYAYSASGLSAGQLSATSCTKCPSGATCPGTTTVPNCGNYAYRTGTNKNYSCKDCPVANTGTSMASGMCVGNSTSITACYISKGITGADSSGEYVLEGNC